MTKALDTAKTKWQAEKDAAVSEAEKLAKMTAEQKAQHEREKREQDLTAREHAIALKEMRAQAAETLTGRGLPIGLLDALSFETAEKCTASIDAVEAAFRAAVQTGVDSRLRGSVPTKGAGVQDTSKMTDAEYYARLKQK